MPGPNETVSFVSGPETRSVPRGKAKGNIEVEGKNLTISCGISH